MELQIIKLDFASGLLELNKLRASEKKSLAFSAEKNIFKHQFRIIRNII